MHQRNLLGELVGHRRAIGLVVGGQIVAERPARQIERRGDELRLMLLQQLAQHRHEDVDGVGGLPCALRSSVPSACGSARDTRGTSASCRR